MTTRERLESVDLVRGLVMVLMLLDHTRDFVHYASWQWDPLDLTHTSVALFFTRWITHFCAPIFVFLAGTSAYFIRQRGRPIPELRKYLVTRGVLLVLLEVTVVRCAMSFDVDYRFLGSLQVMFAIGISMIALGLLVALPTRVIGALGIAIIALHNLLDRFHAPTWNGPDDPVPSAAWRVFSLLHQEGPFPVAGWPSPVVMVNYPVLAWIGVIAAGYAFGAVYDLEPVRRRRTMLRLGGALTIAFVLLRALDVYGDPNDWSSTQPRGPIFVVLSFLDTHKYPPSLLYLHMTLGPGIALLGALDGRVRQAAPSRWLVTLGRVPLFYYLLQWPVAHLAGIIVSAAAGRALWPFFTNAMMIIVRGAPQDYGFPLWVVYACWIAGLLVLYPLCAWYARRKATQPRAWMAYL